MQNSRSLLIHNKILDYKIPCQSHYFNILYTFQHTHITFNFRENAKLGTLENMLEMILNLELLITLQELCWETATTFLQTIYLLSKCSMS